MLALPYTPSPLPNVQGKWLKLGLVSVLRPEEGSSMLDPYIISGQDGGTYESRIQKGRIYLGIRRDTKVLEESPLGHTNSSLAGFSVC